MNMNQKELLCKDVVNLQKRLKGPWRCTNAEEFFEGSHKGLLFTCDDYDAWGIYCTLKGIELEISAEEIDEEVLKKIISKYNLKYTADRDDNYIIYLTKQPLSTNAPIINQIADNTY